MTKYILTFLFLSFVGTNIGAQETEGETLYITDVLRLSLYEHADSKSKVFKYLTSGAKLIASQNSGSYAFVLTEDGKKGWVKRGFLVSTLPTVLLLEQELEKTQALVQELNKLSDSKLVIEQYEKDMDALTLKLEEMTHARDTVQTEIDKINHQNQEMQRQAELVTEAKQHKAAPLEVLMTIMIGYWRYLLPILFGFMLIGFILAKQILESRIKKKFQGIKVW